MTCLVRVGKYSTLDKLRTHSDTRTREKGTFSDSMEANMILMNKKSYWNWVSQPYGAYKYINLLLVGYWLCNWIHTVTRVFVKWCRFLIECQQDIRPVNLTMLMNFEGLLEMIMLIYTFFLHQKEKSEWQNNTYKANEKQYMHKQRRKYESSVKVFWTIFD